MRGPQADRFPDEAWNALLASEYTVSLQSNRIGIRLSGPALEADGGVDIISSGLVTGAVQVAGDGQPIVMLPGRATIGGYAVVAVVISVDHWMLAQARPGARVRFREVSRDAAIAACKESALDVIPSTKEEQPVFQSHSTSDEASSDWSPTDVLQIIREIATQDVEEFRMEIAAAGVSLHIRKHANPAAVESFSKPPSISASPDERAEQQDGMARDTREGEILNAPVLGVFYRRPSPDEAPFAAEGDAVAADQVLGMIEVMKTYHNVMSPCDGVLAEFLVEDGQTVEFGTPLVRIVPA